jgi:uncharacterized protein YodC (DUF2158 family)
MEDYKKGDLVRLRSGGPTMTVASSGQNGVHCTWFPKIAGEYAAELANLLAEKEMLEPEATFDMVSLREGIDKMSSRSV